MVYCQNCGSELNISDTFCSSCGEQIKPFKETNQESTPQQVKFSTIPSQRTSNSFNQNNYQTQQSFQGSKRLYRSKNDKVLAGVCGGLARYFNIDPILVRIGFVIFSLIYGSGLLIYVLMAILVPVDPTQG